MTRMDERGKWPTVARDAVRDGRHLFPNDDGRPAGIHFEVRAVDLYSPQVGRLFHSSEREDPLSEMGV